jgi:CubicO group peptidase (beta-lactamase class C family)
VLGASLLPKDTFGATSEIVTHEGGTKGALGQFAQAYMKMMRAPGMTVSMLSREKTSSCVYGFSNVGAKQPVTVEQPFWIGSICKSFVGIVAMQLRDEGKLDLHKPVLEIMRDLPFTNDFGPITAHHLLTHTSGLPNWLQLFSSDPSQRAKQAYAPGNRFAYCNLGYDTLGLLIAHLDGRSWPEAVTARILKPLDMSGASGQIDDAVQARMPVGYHFQYRDRACTVADPLVPVGYLLMSNAAGSIAATPEDMSKYMRMLVQRGIGPSGRLVSEEGFQLFTKPYIKASVLSPNAGYGYGIGVETVDGRTMLRHTGGATAFASSILVDLDEGVGAFASINSMQEYRPNPVTKFAVDLLYAEKSGHNRPSQPTIENPLQCKKPEEFTGDYKGSKNESLDIKTQNGALVLTSSCGSTQLRPLGTNLFSAADNAVLSGMASDHGPSEFALVFTKDSSGNVTELSYGSRSYTRGKLADSAGKAPMERAERYKGVYTNDSPWMGPLRVVERNGKLWLDGVEELHPSGENRFSVEGGEGALELEFVSFLDGRANMLRVAGEVLRRVELIPTA